MSNLDNDDYEVVGGEVDMKLIEVLVDHLRCEEEDTVVIRKTDVMEMVNNQSIEVDESQFKNLLDILFNEQNEDSKFNVYQRLGQMITIEIQEEVEEGEGEEEHYEEDNKEAIEEEEKDQHQDPDPIEEISSQEPKQAHANDSEETVPQKDVGKANNGIEKEIVQDQLNIKQEMTHKDNKDQSNNKIDNKDNNNDSIQIKEEIPQRVDKPLSDLDLLSQNYINNTKNQKTKNITKLFDNNAHILNQNYKDFSSPVQENKDLTNEQFQSNQFETIIQPSNDFHYSLLSLNSISNTNNQNKVKLFKDSLNTNTSIGKDERKEDEGNRDQRNQPKQVTQPSSENPTKKLKVGNNKQSDSSKDQDYFFQLFQTSTSKQIQILSEKINKLSSKSHTRNLNRDLFSINQHKPSFQENSIITPLRMTKMKKNLNIIDDNNNNSLLPKSYLKQTMNQNFNEILKGSPQSRITYSFKTKNFNLKNPKEKHLYIETLKNDLKEFSYQKEQSKKKRDDAFGEIDDRLEGLMKKNHLGIYSQKEETKNTMVEDQPNQRYIDQELDGEKNDIQQDLDINNNDSDQVNKEKKEDI